MDPSAALIVVWLAIGVVAGLLFRSDAAAVTRMFDGALGALVSASLVFKLHLGLPFRLGTLTAAVLGSLAFVAMLDRFRRN